MCCIIISVIGTYMLVVELGRSDMDATVVSQEMENKASAKPCLTEHRGKKIENTSLCFNK